MGADIHAYIEFYSQKEFQDNPSGCYVNCFSSRLGFGRNYTLFGLLAGVRSMNGPVIPVRGVPTQPEMSWTCKYDYYLGIIEREEDSQMFFGHSRDRLVLRSEAEEMISRNESRYVNSKRNSITDPTYHSATHLFFDDLCLVRKRYLLETIEFESELSRKNKKDLISFIDSKHEKDLISFSFPSHECSMLYATLKCMQALSNSSEDNDTQARFVCWFDS